MPQVSIRPGETEAGVPEFDGWAAQPICGPQVLVSWLERDEKRNPSLSLVLRHTGTCPHTHAQKCVNTYVHSECEKFQDGDRS